MKKTYIKPKSRLMGLEAETLFAGSPIPEQTVSDDPATLIDGNVIMEGRDVIRARGAWDDEW